MVKRVVKQEFKKTEYLSEGLRLTILGCFRYSLGRRTYMPSHTVWMIKQHQEVFINQDWKIFIEEIEEAEDLGDDCDIITWNELKDFAKTELKRGWQSFSIIRGVSKKNGKTSGKTRI